MVVVRDRGSAAKSEHGKRSEPGYQSSFLPSFMPFLPLSSYVKPTPQMPAGRLHWFSVASRAPPLSFAARGHSGAVARRNRDTRRHSYQAIRRSRVPLGHAEDARSYAVRVSGVPGGEGATLTQLLDTSREAAVRRLITGSVENLLATWNRELCLFPYSSRIVAGRLVNDVTHPLAVRYTLNGLLGLVRAARAGADQDLDEVRGWSTRFFRMHGSRIETLADAGLAVLLQYELENKAGTAEALDTVRSLRIDTQRHVMQDLAWALWGATAAQRAGVAGAGETARGLLARIAGELTSPLGLPYHSSRRYRRRVVSFGALTYFLRALHEAATVLEDDRAERLYSAGLRQTLSLQGELGDWPWMIDPASGHALDRYPVFAVHQDSMAMLFLLPALERGLPGVEHAIDRSLAWAVGRNELGISMYVDEPVFFAYRSIERRDRAPRVRRYLRSSAHVVTRRPARTEGASALRLNSECRSYHLGWILYAWSDHLGGGASSATTSLPREIGSIGA